MSEELTTTRYLDVERLWCRACRRPVRSAAAVWSWQAGELAYECPCCRAVLTRGNASNQRRKRC